MFSSINLEKIPRSKKASVKYLHIEMCGGRRIYFQNFLLYMVAVIND